MALVDALAVGEGCSCARIGAQLQMFAHLGHHQRKLREEAHHSGNPRLGDSLGEQMASVQR